MADEPEAKSFWLTLPGALTAAATFLTAATGLIVTLNQIGYFGKSPAPVASNATIATPVATTVPQAASTAPIPVPNESVGVPPLANAGNNGALVGVWLNNLLSPRNGKPDSRLVIRRRPDGTLTLQGWGNCEPKECDWGVAPLEVVAGDTNTDLTGLRATTKLVHVVSSRNTEEVTYLTLKGTGVPNSLMSTRRFELYVNGHLKVDKEKTLAFTRQKSAPNG
jgi:hypothetical protein